MRVALHTSLCVAWLGWALLVVEPAAAASLAGALEIFDEARDPSTMSLNEAASRAQDRYGGQVLSVEPTERGDRRGWRVKVLLDDGRVKTLFVDQHSGAVRDRRERR